MSRLANCRPCLFLSCTFRQATAGCSFKKPLCHGLWTDSTFYFHKIFIWLLVRLLDSDSMTALGITWLLLDSDTTDGPCLLRTSQQATRSSFEKSLLMFGNYGPMWWCLVLISPLLYLRLSVIPTPSCMPIFSWLPIILDATSSPPELCSATAWVWY